MARGERSHLVLLGQLGEQVLVLQDVRVGVEGGEGVEEEGGELGGDSSPGCLLPGEGHGEAEGELGGGHLSAGKEDAGEVPPGRGGQQGAGEMYQVKEARM